VLGLHKIKVRETVAIDEDVKAIHYPWIFLRLNDWAIRRI
jgi:hypothetical protein